VSEPTATPKRKSKSETQKDVMSILLGDEIKAAEAAPNSPLSLDIADLVPYTNHPFKLYEGDRLDDMVRSIKELGVLMPVIVRPNEDETYEILSGHNRANAAKLAGLKEIPVIIKTGLSDDEAKLIVTETNLVQRSFADLSHSERAFAGLLIKRKGVKCRLFIEWESCNKPIRQSKIISLAYGGI